MLTGHERSVPGLDAYTEAPVRKVGGGGGLARYHISLIAPWRVLISFVSFAPKGPVFHIDSGGTGRGGELSDRGEGGGDRVQVDIVSRIEEPLMATQARLIGV